MERVYSYNPGARIGHWCSITTVQANLLWRWGQQHSFKMAIFQENAGNLLPECHVSNLNFNGGACDNWSYKKYKAPVKSSPAANQHQRRFISSSKNTDDCRKLINRNRSRKRRERTVVWLWSRLVCRAPTASVDYPWWCSPSVSSLPLPSSPPPAMCQFIVVASGKSSSTLFLQPLLILLVSVSLRPLKNSALKSAEILLWGTLVGWLVFNCIFSTNRLYHAIGVWNISCSAGDKTNTS